MGAPVILSSHGFIEIQQTEWIGTAHAVGTIIDSGPVFVLGMSEIVVSVMENPTSSYGNCQNLDKCASVFQSVDGVNWDVWRTISIQTGNQPYTFTVPIVGRFAKFRWSVIRDPQAHMYILCYARATRSDELVGG